MFWLNNPKVLIESDEIFPYENMTSDQKYNSIARFSLVFLIIIYLLKGDMKWMSFSVTLLLLTIILYKNEEKFTNSNCTKITKENPYGNFTMGDYFKDVNRPSVCDFSIKDSIKKASDNFSGILTDDIYEKNINFRDFYTLPVTKVVNDQDKFAKFLLGSSGECKHDGNNCLKNEDTKFHRGRFFNGNRKIEK